MTTHKSLATPDRLLPLFCLLPIALLAAASIFSPWGASRGAFAKTIPTKSVDVARETTALVEADWIVRDVRFSPSKADASGTLSSQTNALGVTTAQDAAGGCDGVKNGRWGFHTDSNEKEPWWQVDLGDVHELDRVVIYNRIDRGCEARTKSIRVLTAGADGDTASTNFEEVYQHNGQAFYGVGDKGPLVVELAGKKVRARVVRLHVPGNCSFALDEVEVYAADDPETNIALGKPAGQKSVGQYSFPGTMGVTDVDVALARAKSGLPAAGLFSLVHTRDVIDRAGKLAERLRPEADAARLKPLVAKLAELSGRVAKLQLAGETSDDLRREIHFEARQIARQIAFANPLLNFDKLLFIKRHDAGGPFHMCDQFYGCNAKPGGGLFVLSEPFSDRPKLRNVLENSVVENGRLKGKQLEGGSVLSPELSFDGKTILFAYSECKATKTYQWAPEYSYHIFKVNVDGTGLTQLTDGPDDDFDPCFLPSGRIVFITERRGGYLRCGRHCPVYTMFSMEPDGSDVICISFHETHEWQPSINNDGMIVYTRWDYVDRDTNIAHHIWTCFPDGRDPRSPHGNYPTSRNSRPWMEMDIRAIPGSHKFVATTGAHHGHAFGSLVLIDSRIVDDNAESQLERLTPEVRFPEAEANIGQNMIYATAWPLSEDDYLCAYDAGAKNHGIYWIDRYGNRELLYRDPSIRSISPIPLRARPKPPVIPDRTIQTAKAIAKANGKIPPATVAVMNVYDSDVPWPEGTKIDALRIIQVLPKTTPPPNQPRIGCANQTNARAVLGTVPVEKDGSVYFEAPAGKELYFQVIDEQGLAVQSMRSGTYLHPGERLTCHGCHEPKQVGPSQPKETPLALMRPASTIRPEADGSSPFSYVRLVQPVLDRNCVGCHTEKKALDLTGAVDGGHGWTRSYNNLAAKYGFYFHVGNGSINSGVHGGSRTIPGQFGAKASGLMKYLGKEHYGVKLSGEDFHRMTLWLDSNSEFYGSYEDTAAQSRGEVVHPTLD